MVILGDNYKMRIMTFNIRFENDRDGPNSWVYRRGLVVRLIEQYSPSILGTQEGRWSQLLYLKDHLTGYKIHAPDRVIDDTCQYPTLYLKKNEFDVLNAKEFWLSKTPEVHRSKNWDSAFPRMVSCARLSMGKCVPFWVAVTHLDHMGTEARYEQGRLIADWIRAQSDPVILMGDFNDDPKSPVHQLLTSSETGLRDTWQILDRSEDSDSTTHHDFNGTLQKSRIDWILVSPQFRVTDASIIKDHFRSRYPSDHFPYMVDLSTSLSP